MEFPTMGHEFASEEAMPVVDAPEKRGVSELREVLATFDRRVASIDEDIAREPFITKR